MKSFVIRSVCPFYHSVLEGSCVVEVCSAVEGTLEAVCFHRNAEVFPTEADVQGQVGANFPIVLEEDAEVFEDRVANARGTAGLELSQIGVEGLADLDDAAEDVIEEAVNDLAFGGVEALLSDGGSERGALWRCWGCAGVRSSAALGGNRGQGRVRLLLCASAVGSAMGPVAWISLSARCRNRRVVLTSIVLPISMPNSSPALLRSK